jgi:hypothetical protein
VELPGEVRSQLKEFATRSEQGGGEAIDRGCWWSWLADAIALVLPSGWPEVCMLGRSG